MQLFDAFAIRRQLILGKSSITQQRNFCKNVKPKSDLFAIMLLLIHFYY